MPDKHFESRLLSSNLYVFTYTRSQYSYEYFVLSTQLVFIFVTKFPLKFVFRSLVQEAISLRNSTEMYLAYETILSSSNGAVKRFQGKFYTCRRREHK